ncbi:MAG: UDP-N-acetylmuramate--L-alanine ligase [Planctomycetota bacterium]|jgi:UDP-N-acetylmuramate--alanine ligase|nr:UDP-N-acetylmuramate--L-alanine ligase [Planctomycetota bacterium]HBO51367.1 UDP-N-acetylmuramate--L-alanine ligase [Planctomycetota bacterium]
MQKPGKVHLVGMLGTGVRGLVSILRARNVHVSGSDSSGKSLPLEFQRLGVECSPVHEEANLGSDVDFLVHTAAVGDDNAEVRKAHRLGIPVLKYSEFLGKLMGEGRGLAVAGTHGKTTTSSMTSWILYSAGKDPSFVIGGRIPELGSSRQGKGCDFVAEACEYDRSFLQLKPEAAVVTNVEEEHLDCFKDMEDILGAFQQFINRVPKKGLLVLNADDPQAMSLAPAAVCRNIQTFSLDSTVGDWQASQLRSDGLGSVFILTGPGGIRQPVKLGMPGRHNVKNALAAAAICRWVGVSAEKISEGLESFPGVHRRFEILARDPVTVIDDYAHHPTEVEALLSAARDVGFSGKVIGVFQPHQFSRLRQMLDAFAEALAGFDEILVTKPYQARDSREDQSAVSSNMLTREIELRGGTASDTPAFRDARARLDEIVLAGDAVIFMGAGSITALASEYAGKPGAIEIVGNLSKVGV